MRKVLLTATVQSHIAQFHKPLIDMLHDNGYEVHVAAKNNLGEKNGLQLNEPDKVFDVPFDRSPLSKKNILAYKELKRILLENNYNIVHCNTPMGGIVTRLATKRYRKKGLKVFYTAHGFHFYDGAPLKNWLIYYPIEKLFARYTDKLITISNEDYNLALRKKFNTKIERIHGVGANTMKYFLPSNELKQNLRRKEGYSEYDFICICTGELNDNKNQITVLRAVPIIVEQIPSFKLILAGNGPKHEDLQNFIDLNNLKKYVTMLGYVTDLERYVMLSDLAISASKREGLGLNLIEAMLCGKPIVGSRNRGHNELINENGFLVDAKDSKQFADAITKLYNDYNLYKKMGKRSLEISKQYTRENSISELKKIYLLL